MFKIQSEQSDDHSISPKPSNKPNSNLKGSMDSNLEGQNRVTNDNENKNDDFREEKSKNDGNKLPHKESLSDQFYLDGEEPGFEMKISDYIEELECLDVLERKLIQADVRDVLGEGEIHLVRTLPFKRIPDLAASAEKRSKNVFTQRFTRTFTSNPLRNPKTEA